MSKIVWDKTGEHFYETGVDHGVFYPYNSTSNQYIGGVAWNGLTAVNEQPSGAEPSPLYADNIKYLNLISAEEYAATVEAYTAPDEFLACDGFDELAKGITIGQQPRSQFGLSFRTLIGNDTVGNKKGYKITCIYNCLASPSERSHSTVNESPEAQQLSWSISTTPAPVTDKSPTAVVVIDSTKTDPAQLAELEGILYGTANSEARLPFPDEIAEIVGAIAVTVKLTNLTVGSLNLVPDFDPSTGIYTVKTPNASDVVTATPETGATVSMTLNGSTFTSGSEATWDEGTNTVVAVVTKSGASSRAYVVTVTKESA